MRARGRLHRGTYVCVRIFAPEAHGFLLREEGVVANIQLKPTPEQAKLLRDSLERCNAACNEISERGLDAGKTRN
jgi:hypothetical protein